MSQGITASAQEDKYKFTKEMECNNFMDEHLKKRHTTDNNSCINRDKANGIAENNSSASYEANFLSTELKPSWRFRSKPLVHRKELPKHLQFNPYIETGYRPLLSVWECIQSLFYIHNETVNIITHGIPMLYIIVWWKNMIPWNEISVPILPYTHILSTVSPWVGSTVYHLFMNHRSGEGCYKNLLHLDMFGIWITQSFGALTPVYASVFCLSRAWIWRVLGVYCLVSLWCLYKALKASCAMSRRLSFSMAVVMQLILLSWRKSTYGGGHRLATSHYFMQASHARNPWDRRFCYTFPFLMRVASVTLRWSSLGGGHPDAFRHVLLQDLLAVVGGFVGALRIPEKWVPGKLDFIANSHHIMHVIVVYAVYHLHQGAVLDMVWLSSNGTCPSAVQ